MWNCFANVKKHYVNKNIWKYYNFKWIIIKAEEYANVALSKENHLKLKTKYFDRKIHIQTTNILEQSDEYYPVITP